MNKYNMAAIATLGLTTCLGMIAQPAAASGTNNGVLDTINKTSSTVQGAANSVRQANNAAKSVNNVAKTPASTPAKQAAAPAAAPAAGSAPVEGANLQLKLDKVKLLDSPKADANTVATLSKKDGVVYMGTTSGPFLKVSTDQGDGWIDKHLTK